MKGFGSEDDSKGFGRWLPKRFLFEKSKNVVWNDCKREKPTNVGYYWTITGKDKIVQLYWSGQWQFHELVTNYLLDEPMKWTEEEIKC